MKKTIELPKQIAKLIELGLWKINDNCQLLKKLRQEHNWKLNISLIENFELEQNGLKSLAEDSSVGDLYGVYLTNQRNDKTHLDWIDANKAIEISVNYDEECICLDYRFSKTNPRILASFHCNLSSQVLRWKEIAVNIDDLILQLGIRC